MTHYIPEWVKQVVTYMVVVPVLACIAVYFLIEYLRPIQKPLSHLGEFDGAMVDPGPEYD
jgi:hypothetical protein